MRGTPGWSRWWSTPCCAARPTTRCSRGPRRWAGTRRRGWSSWRAGRRPGRPPRWWRRCAAPPAGPASTRWARCRAAGWWRCWAGSSSRCGRRPRSVRASATDPWWSARRCRRLFAAGRSARAALSGLVAVRAWPEAPRPVLADDLLPERVLAGDTPARRRLVDTVHRPLEASGALLETVATYLSCGGALEATARALFVHPNTVRYRLRRAGEVCGYDVTDPRDAYVVRVALALGRLSGAPRRALPVRADGEAASGAAVVPTQL
nr:helix-turn-helix domain-containing protein [Angustibacter aerolatus]